MNELDTQTIKGIIGEKFYFVKATENFLYKDNKRTEEVDGIKVKIYGTKDPERYYTVKIPGTLEVVKGFAIHTEVSFDNLTGKLWAKVVRNFGTVELSMKADDITPVLK
jgi:hypothetical protein